MWRNHFSQQWNAHGVNDVRQTEIHTPEPLVPMLSASEVEMAIEKVKRHKSPSIDQIPAELIKASGMAIHYEIHKLNNSILKEEELPEQSKEVIMVPTYNYKSISPFSNTHKNVSNILLSRLTP